MGPLSTPDVQDTLRQKSERIEELEEALRESVQITAEREMVLAQEEAARSLQEKQVHNCFSTNAQESSHNQSTSSRTQHTHRVKLYINNKCFHILRFFLPRPSAAMVVFLILSSPPSSPTVSVSFSVLLSFAFLFSLVLSLLHTASQKHSLKPMHESQLAHFKWSKV